MGLWDLAGIGNWARLGELFETLPTERREVCVTGIYWTVLVQ